MASQHSNFSIITSNVPSNHIKLHHEDNSTSFSSESFSCCNAIYVLTAFHTICCWDSAFKDLLCPQTMLPNLMNSGINNNRSFTNLMNLLDKIEIVTLSYFKITSLHFTFSLKSPIHWYTSYLHHLHIHHFILRGIFHV